MTPSFYDPDLVVTHHDDPELREDDNENNRVSDLLENFWKYSEGEKRLIERDRDGERERERLVSRNRED